LFGVVHANVLVHQFFFSFRRDTDGANLHNS